jgi:hypothetical protein
MGAERRGRPRKPAGARPSPEQLRRLKFIERSAYWSGRVGRRAVAHAFDVSLGHASQDFARYKQLAPSNLIYDNSEACYRPSGAFRPFFGAEPPEVLLEVLAASVGLPDAERARWLGFDAPAARVGPLPTRIAAQPTALILRAMLSGANLRFTYQSLESPEPAGRRVHPTGLIHTGRRWLLRAWDFDRAAFRDFAIARVLKAELLRVAPAAPRDDDWHERIDLVVEPAPELSASQAAIIAREYGMALDADERWRLRHDVRRALLPYLLDHLGLRPGEGRVGDIREVCLVNYSDLAAFDRRGDSAG